MYDKNNVGALLNRAFVIVEPKGREIGEVVDVLLSGFRFSQVQFVIGLNAYSGTSGGNPWAWQTEIYVLQQD